jgi:hypothetical protein
MIGLRRRGAGMKLRIAIWASLGVLIVVFWSLYFIALKPGPVGPMWILLDLICPIALARQIHMSVYFVTLMNAGTYALIGAIVETMRRHYIQARLHSN